MCNRNLSHGILSLRYAFHKFMLHCARSAPCLRGAGYDDGTTVYGTYQALRSRRVEVERIASESTQVTTVRISSPRS